MGIQEELAKKYGKGILVLGSTLLDEKVLGYSTGSPVLDAATGIGGLPAGRITEIYGLPSGGKTSVCLSTIGRLHNSSPSVFAAYIDAENALDFDYAIRCGVDLNRLYIHRPEWGEQAFDVAEGLIRSGEVSIVIIDSLPANSPRAEMEGNMGDAHIGLLPRLLSQFCRRTAFAIRESEVGVVVVNQVRDKIGRMGFTTLDSPGGYALKHHSSMRILLRNAGELQDGSGNTYGSKIDFIVKKSKVSQPYKTGTFEIWGNHGVCREAGLLDLALDRGIVVQSGSWFKYKDKVIGQGRMNAVQELSNLELKLEIEKEVFSG